MKSWRPLLLALLVPIVSVWSQPTSHDGSLTTRQTCSRNSYSLVSDDDGIWPYRKYVTTNATSPEFKIEGTGEGIAEGLVFLTIADSGFYGDDGVKQQAAVIMSTQGDLVWSGPTGSTSNLRTAPYKGEDVITVWSGSGGPAKGGKAADGTGMVRIFNAQYEKIATVCLSPKSLNIASTSSCVCDTHESYLTERNTMLVTAYNVSQADLTSVGGPKAGWIRNSLAVEMDVETNEPVFVWNPLDHMHFNVSRLPLLGTGNDSTNPYDWFHMNSIQPFRGGYLINSRHTWSSYFVNKNGAIEWEINGATGGDFGSLPAGYNFSWQHDARIQPYGSSGDQLLYTNFNDLNYAPTFHHQSSGIGLILTIPADGLNSLQPYSRPVDSQHKLDPFAGGSYQTLSNGNVLLGYGIVPFMTEFGSISPDDSDVRWSVQFAYNNHNNTASSYRAFKEVWHATPSGPVELVVQKQPSDDTMSNCDGDSGMRGYVSWNGATDVTHYEIYAGVDASDMKSSRVCFDNMGFETEFVVPKDMEFIQVAAFEGAKLVGKSRAVAV